MATAKGHGHAHGPDGSCPIHGKMEFAKAYQPAALNVQRLIGVLLSAAGAYSVINPEVVAEHLLKDAGTELQLYSLVSLLGALILQTGLLIMTGYMSFTAFWMYAFSQIAFCMSFYHYWQEDGLLTEYATVVMGLYFITAMLCAVGAGAMYHEHGLRPKPGMAQDIFRLGVCYAFWMKGVAFVLMIDDAEDFIFYNPLHTKHSALLMKWIGMQAMQAGLLIILNVLKGKAHQWVGGSMFFYAALIYLYYDAGVFTFETFLDAAVNVFVSVLCLMTYEPLFPEVKAKTA